MLDNSNEGVTSEMVTVLRLLSLSKKEKVEQTLVKVLKKLVKLASDTAGNKGDEFQTSFFATKNVYFSENLDLIELNAGIAEVIENITPKSLERAEISTEFMSNFRNFFLSRASTSENVRSASLSLKSLKVFERMGDVSLESKETCQKVTQER